MSVDASDLDRLAHDFGLVPAKVAKKVKPIMAKTGLAMKGRMQKDLRGSPHFKSAAPSVDYDLTVSDVFGSGVIRVEVGPNAERHPAAALAGIAYFGGARGGGGTVADPIVPMRQEEPILLGYLSMAMEDLL